MNDELPLSLDKPATPVAQFHALPPARLRFWLLVAAISAGLLYLLAPVLTPFLFAALLAYLGDPLIDRLETRGFSRTGAVAYVFCCHSAWPAATGAAADSGPCLPVQEPAAPPAAVSGMVQRQHPALAARYPGR